MDPTVTDMPGNEFDWITEETHKIFFTVSVMPGNINQKGGDSGCPTCMAPWTRRGKAWPRGSMTSALLNQRPVIP